MLLGMTSPIPNCGRVSFRGVAKIDDAPEGTGGVSDAGDGS